MKRIVIGLVAAAALTFGGIFASTAQAHGPHHRHHHHHHCRPAPVVHRCYSPYGGYGGYGGGYGYRQAVVPYGVGYAGGWQPYQGIVVQRPGFGLSIGF